MMMPFGAISEEKKDDEAIRLKQLGAAFRYGMACELSLILRNMSGEDGINLYASIAYMFLNDLISAETVKKVENTIGCNWGKEENLRSVTKKISEMIFEQLMKKYSFGSLDELVLLLDKHKISDWYFKQGQWIVGKCEQGLFEYEDYLYYISNDNGDFALVKINTSQIDCENLDTTYEKKIVAYGFSEILGFDRNIKRIYLRMDNQMDFYHVYDILSDTFKVNRGTFLTLKEGIPYAINRENCVIYLIGDTEHVIKKVLENEQYKVLDENFLVLPRSTDESIFCPYYVTFDGKVKNADVEVSRRLIWSEITKFAIYDVMWNPYLGGLQSENCIWGDLNTSITIHNILDTLGSYIPDSDKCKNKRYILFLNILKLLGNYVDDNEDITRLMFELYDVNLRLRKDNDLFPSEELYWRFKEIDVSGESKKKVIEFLNRNDYIGLGEFFCDKNVPVYKKIRPMIGTIGWGTYGIEIFPVELKSGMIIGNMIIPMEIMNAEGIVSYDSFHDRYIVTCNRIINSEERLLVESKLNLYGKNISYVEQSV